MFSLSVAGYEIVSHILTLGYAAMAAAIFFFILTMNQTLPKYRISSVLSVVVMISALLLLYAQKQSWTNAYMFNGQNYVLKEGADLFSNGYRYLNWLIDVPMLLIQILFVATLVKINRGSTMKQFFFSGPMMILTGYIGQFYEPGRLDANLTAWLVWGGISTIFFIHVLYLITKVIQEGKANMDPSSASIFGTILPLFYFAWFLYPGAYLLPILMEWGISYEFTVVGQQITYTIADILSKVVYGVLLTVAATRLSTHAGYKMPGETS
jgi:bacteriorhodopsin